MKLYEQNTDGGGEMVCFKHRASLVVHIYDLPAVFVVASPFPTSPGVGALCP